MNSIGGKTLSPDIIGTATISGAKLFLMKDLKLIYIFQDKLIIKFYFKVTKRNANLPFLSVNFPSVCSEITSQIVCKFLQIIVYSNNSHSVVLIHCDLKLVIKCYEITLFEVNVHFFLFEYSLCIQKIKEICQKYSRA